MRRIPPSERNTGSALQVAKAYPLERWQEPVNLEALDIDFFDQSHFISRDQP
jgi:hypothetical protein